MSAPLVTSQLTCLRTLCQSKTTLNRMSVVQRFMMSDDRENLEYLERTQTSKIAYRQTAGKDPGVLFLPGFMSNMTGRKAVALEGYCRRSGHAFVRFDYQGLGESVGEMGRKDKMFEMWKSDALAVLDELTIGPQILVGSSMGGAIMILLALERPERIHSLLGVATATRFDREVSYTETQETHNSSPGHTTYTVPAEFMSKQHVRIMSQSPMPIKVPVRLIHGMRDDVVPYETSVDLASRLQSKNVDVILRKGGGHRMSEAEDIRLLVDTLGELMKL